ncbi:MAG: TonB-dependent receptor [Vicinamibacterales bacterium]
MKALGIFADDTWQVGRATLNLGVRYDDSKAYFAAQDILDARGNPTGQQSAAVDEVFRWRVVSPRLGLTFKLTESGSSIVKAHYGRYYRGIVTGEFDNTTPSVTPRYLFAGTYDAAGNPEDLALVSDNSSSRSIPT